MHVWDPTPVVAGVDIVVGHMFEAADVADLGGFGFGILGLGAAAFGAAPAAGLVRLSMWLESGGALLNFGALTLGGFFGTGELRGEAIETGVRRLGFNAATMMLSGGLSAGARQLVPRDAPNPLEFSAAGGSKFRAVQVIPVPVVYAIESMLDGMTFGVGRQGALDARERPVVNWLP